MHARGVSRREALRAMGLAAVLAAAPRVAAAQTAGAAAPGIRWNAAAFNAQTVAEALQALGAGTPAPTTEISWGATPEIAENGAVVPVNVTSKIPGTEAIAILNGLAGIELVGADVVEVAPAYDHAQVTALAAAHIGYALLGLYASSPARRPEA